MYETARKIVWNGFVIPPRTPLSDVYDGAPDGRTYAIARIGDVRVKITITKEDFRIKR